MIFVRKNILMSYKLSMLLLFLSSMHMWTFWGIERIVMILSFFTSISFYLFCKSFFVITNKRIISVFLLSLFFLYLALVIENVTGVLGAIVSISIFSVLIFLKDYFRVKLLVFILKCFSALLSVSLLYFLACCLLDISLPFIYTDYADQYYFKNYYFFLTYDANWFFVLPRFQSVFVEPGHLGMVLSLLLYTQKFDLKKWYNIIMMISAILSFSLAAYVLIVIGIIMINVIRNRNSIFYILIAISFAFMSICIFVDRLDQENMFNKLIVERLTIENGDIAGNNRFSNDFEKDFKRKINTTDKWFGWQPNFSIYGGGNAGYKRYIATNGIIGVVVFVLFYLSCCKGYGIYSYSLLLLYLLSFIQRSYPDSEFELIPFICGVSFLQLINVNSVFQKRITG